MSWLVTIQYVYLYSNQSISMSSDATSWNVIYIFLPCIKWCETVLFIVDMEHTLFKPCYAQKQSRFFMCDMIGPNSGLLYIIHLINAWPSILKWLTFLLSICSSPGRSPGMDSETMMMNNVYRDRFPKVRIFITIQVMLICAFCIIHGWSVWLQLNI